MKDPESTPRFVGLVVGRTCEDPLIRGWHEREHDGRSGIAYRAAREDGFLVLRRARGARRVSLLVNAPVGLYTAGLPDVRIIINRRKYELPFHLDQWVFRSYPIESTKDILRIHLYTKNPVSPDKMLNNGDARVLGVLLSAVWQD